MNHPIFHVGEVAIIAASRYIPELVGQECTIVDPLRFRTFKAPNGRMLRQEAYLIELRDGMKAYASSNALRKRFEPGSWDELTKAIGFDPTHRPEVRE